MMKKVNYKKLGFLALSGLTVLMGHNVASAFTPEADVEYVSEPVEAENYEAISEETDWELIKIENENEVNGIVMQISDDKLMINEAQHFEIVGNPDEQLGVLDTENEDWRMVLINEETIFEILEVVNGGLNGEEDVTRTAATLEDISLGDMDQVTVHGYEDENGFVAERVEIWTFTGE